MKLIRAMCLPALVFVFATVARANTIDPGIGLGGTGTCPGFPTQSEISSVQTFTIPTGCIADFTNNTGSPIEALAVTVNTAFSGSFSCIFLPGNVFFSMISMGPNSCTFFGPPPPPVTILSIGTGVSYGIEAFNFGVSSVSITLSAVPEPGAMLLLGTGLAAVAARRKRPKRTGTNA